MRLWAVALLAARGELEEALLSANNAELIDLPIVQLAVDFRWLAVGFWFFWFLRFF